MLNNYVGTMITAIPLVWHSLEKYTWPQNMRKPDTLHDEPQTPKTNLQDYFT